MDLKTKNEANAIIVSVGGRLDTVTAPEYEKQIHELIDCGNISFVVDFEQLEYISSAGLRALLVMAKLLNAKGGQLCFANVSGNVRSVFDMSGFNELFRIESSVTEALADLA